MQRSHATICQSMWLQYDDYLGPVFPPQINLPLTLIENWFVVEKPALSIRSSVNDSYIVQRIKIIKIEVKKIHWHIVKSCCDRNVMDAS